jgi:hypothetical protein
VQAEKHESDMPEEPPGSAPPPEAEGPEILTLKNKDGDPVFVLYPDKGYVAARSLSYRKTLLATLGLVATACLVHWLAAQCPARPSDETLLDYTKALITIPLLMALALYIWNASMSAPLTVTAGRRLMVKIATLRLGVDPFLAERLGVGLTADGRYWLIYHLPRPGRAGGLSGAARRMKFKLSAAAFPTLTAFLADKIPTMWEEVPAQESRNEMG